MESGQFRRRTFTEFIRQALRSFFLLFNCHFNTTTKEAIVVKATQSNENFLFDSFCWSGEAKGVLTERCYQLHAAIYNLSRK